MLEMPIDGHCCFQKGASIIACFRPRWRMNLVKDERFSYGKIRIFWGAFSFFVRSSKEKEIEIENLGYQ